ncbi:RNA-binding protein 33 isoform X2 [Sceloporus undulatus]|uniref:RNA-binding protein 33 isoform X2 n=1 Tax=Sceloporus undulatus TaxID=8520 RepID=UPI001C4A7F4F|nr:RNA-binding protein 33 isoform X2 [Sceloporus undulatus]
MAAALGGGGGGSGGGADDDFDQFDKPGAERSWRRRTGDDDWDSELDDDLLGEDLLTGKKTQSDMSDEELNDDLLQSDNEEDQHFSTQDVSISLNATSGMVTSFEFSESVNDPSIEQDSEYEQGEDELGYDKSEVTEEYAEEYTEEGQYEGQETELTEDQIEYGEDQGEEEIYNDEVLDLEINEPLDEFPDEEYMQSYSEQQVIEQQEYVAEEELEEVAEAQTPPNESEEAVIENLELQEETKEESDEEEEDDEESGRLRFKTERKEGTIIRLSDVTRERRNIPETLELSAEAKAALHEFEERERQMKQGRYGSRRGGRRGGPLMCRGMGEQRRDNNERGRMKDHRPALLATQTAITAHSERIFRHQQPIRNLFQQQQQQQLQGLLPIPPQHHTPPPPPQGIHMPPQLETPRILMTPPPVTSQQPKNIHINPHFKGTVVTPVQVPLLPVPAQPRPAVGPQRFPAPPDFQQNPPGPVPTNFNQAPRLSLQDQWRGPPPPLPPPPPQDRDPFFMGEPRFPSHHLFEQRSPPPPPPLLNSTHPVPGQNPLSFTQPGPAFSQQGQQPMFPRERMVRPNLQPQGPVGVLHFNQPGAANTRPFLPPRQSFVQVPGQPFLTALTQPSMQGPLHPPLQQHQHQQHPQLPQQHQQHQQHQQPPPQHPQHQQHPQPPPQQHHQQHQSHQQQHHLLVVPPQPLIPVAPSQFRPHMQTTQQQSGNRIQCQQRQGLVKARHNTPTQNIVKRPNQQLQSPAQRNSNLRELPIAPLHTIEAASNHRTSTPAVQVKPIASTTPAVRPPAGMRNEQGRTEAKPKTVTPGAQPKVEAKSEPEFPDEDEETRLYRLKIEEQKRLREEILKQKELRRQLQAGARKRELLERLAQQQQCSLTQQQEEETTSQSPTNGNPLLPLPGAPPRQNVKYRLMVKKQDPVVPNSPAVQPKPTNILQAGDNAQFQGQQIKTVKQLRQTRTMPENELLPPYKGVQTKSGGVHMNPSQIARVASVQGQPQELKPGVKRTVMQRANSGSGDGPHVGTKVRVIKLSGGGGENVGFSHSEGLPHRLQQLPDQRHQPVRKVTLTKGTVQQPHQPHLHQLAQIHAAFPPGLKNIPGIHQAKKVIPHGRGRGLAGQMGRGRLMPNKQNLRVVECKPQPCVVSVEGLSSSTTDVQLKNLLMSSLQMLPQQRKAIAKFKEPADALKFQQKFHRHMIDLSHINVALIVE